ncbi:MAG TPA: hypothetical protein VMT68_09975 [Caulobacteraceae bacterium]|nr:hypothetical protein [Caulobacteraceae bacterium]
MKLLALALVPLLAASAANAAPRHGGTTHGIANAALIAAAKSAPLKLIDALETFCDGDTPIAEWLQELTGPLALKTVWTAGKCKLVNDLNPLDAGGRFCVQATLTLRHPKNRRDTPEIEIYLDDPKHGRPGPVYAFRAWFDSADGPDYIRFRKDFESEWRDRFKDAPAPKCTDD